MDDAILGKFRNNKLPALYFVKKCAKILPDRYYIMYNATLNQWPVIRNKR